MKLTDPDVCLQYIEYYGTNANDPPEFPYFVFFGRWVGFCHCIDSVKLVFVGGWRIAKFNEEIVPQN